MKRADVKKEVKKFKNAFFRARRNSKIESKIPQIIFKKSTLLVDLLIDLGVDSVLSVRNELDNLIKT